MKQPIQELRPMILRANQAIVILDAKGILKRVYCLRGEKVLCIDYIKGKQCVKTIYLEDLTLTLKG
jgi:hypothetical protein